MIKRYEFKLTMLLMAALLTTILNIPAMAAPGDPDYTFGIFGVKIDNHSVYNMYPKIIAQQSDGKLLVAGVYTTVTFPSARVLLRRYNTNGSVDGSFGLSGFAVAQKFNPSIVSIYGDAVDMLVQSNGKIVIAGNSPSGMTIWRFTAIGELDTTFGSDGVVILESSTAHKMKIVSYQGKYIVATHSNSTETRRLRRLNVNGSLDLAFGTFFGQSIITISGGDFPFVINPSNGKMIFGGYQDAPALQHFNSNGTYDTAFGTNGITNIPMSADCGTYTMTPSWFSSLALQSDGNLIAGAGVNSLSPGCMEEWCYGHAIVRLQANDTLDTGYGSDGFAVKCGGYLGGPRIKLVANGTNQLLAAFGSTISGLPLFRRYNSAGLQNLNLTNEFRVDFLGQQVDGKIVTVISINGDIKLARYLP